MRKIVITVMGTLSALVLVISFDASRRDSDVSTVTAPDDGATSEPTAPTDSGTEASPTDAGSPSLPPSEPPSESPPTSSAPSTPTTPAGVSGTFTGKEVQTEWGIVQVRITVKNGKITKATALKYPDENPHDQAINSWAIPNLQQQTVQNQGRIDNLSGATVSSEGYRESLQSAMDKAHL